MCLAPMWVTEEMDAFEMKCSKEPGAAPHSQPSAFHHKSFIILKSPLFLPPLLVYGLPERERDSLPTFGLSQLDSILKNIHVQILFFFSFRTDKKEHSAESICKKNEIAFKKHIKYSQGPVLYAHWACSLCSAGQPSHPSI